MIYLLLAALYLVAASLYLWLRLRKLGRIVDDHDGVLTGTVVNVSRLIKGHAELVTATRDGFEGTRTTLSGMVPCCRCGCMVLAAHAGAQRATSQSGVVRLSCTWCLPELRRLGWTPVERVSA